MGWREEEIRKAEAAYYNAQSAWESATVHMNSALAKLQTLRENKTRVDAEKSGGYTSSRAGLK